VQIRKRAGSESFRATQLSQSRVVQWTGHDGETVYGAFFPPASESFESSGKPPLIVNVHGGPTSQARNVFDGRIQFFATRGFAVLELYYRGTTGFGRAYQDKLLGQWGVYDVEDAASGAAYLAAEGLVDPDKRVIIGSSAGGYTVLHSLVAKPGFYTAGISLYGISNLFTLAADTHKFEAGYNDLLLGALPEAAAVWRERSPIFHAERIADPVIIFQGTDDKVVPIAQAEAIVAALRARGVPYEYHVYEGEGHGFRKPENVEHWYKAALDFLRQYVVYA
jgi:dipeptidyl aminopeptidase/acylaminoacyl peptidase